MTEPRHGTGASGWCLGRKRCPECAYAGCDCPCHDGTKRAEPQRDRLGEAAPKAYNRDEPMSRPPEVLVTPSEGLTTDSTPD